MKITLDDGGPSRKGLESHSSYGDPCAFPAPLAV